MKRKSKSTIVLNEQISSNNFHASKVIRRNHHGHQSSGSFPVTGFPLPARFFPRLNVTEKEADAMLDKVEDLRIEAMNNCLWVNNIDLEWKLAISKKQFRETGVRTYLKRTHDGSIAFSFLSSSSSSSSSSSKRRPRQIDFRSTAKVSMPLEDVLRYFYADNTMEERENCATVYPGFLDAAVLHVVERRSENKPFCYFGINWMASMNSSLFGKKRDICYIKSMGKTMDASDKKEVGFVVTHSVDLNDVCPSFQKTHGLLRTRISAVLLLKETSDQNMTSLIWQGSYEHGAMSTNNALSMVHGFISSLVVKLNKVGDARFLTRHTEVSKKEWVPKNSRKNCFICARKFTLFRTRHHCRSCGEIMCRDCEIVYQEDEEEQSKTKRFCKKCIISERKEFENSQNLNRKQKSEFICTSSITTSPHQRHKQVSFHVTEEQDEQQQEWEDQREMEGDFSMDSASAASDTSSHSYGKYDDTSDSGDMEQPDIEPLCDEDSFGSTNLYVPSPPRSVPSAISHGSDQSGVTRGGRMRTRSLVHSPRGKKQNVFERQSMASYESVYDSHEYSSSQSETRYDSDTSCHNYLYPPSSSSHTGTGPVYDTTRESLAARLYEMNCKAQEALATTIRTSCLMGSDAASTYTGSSRSGPTSRGSAESTSTSSAPASMSSNANINSSNGGTSTASAFHHLDNSIAKQADLLNAIGMSLSGTVGTPPVSSSSTTAHCKSMEIPSYSDMSDRFELIE